MQFLCLQNMRGLKARLSLRDLIAAAMLSAPFFASFGLAQDAVKDTETSAVQTEVDPERAREEAELRVEAEMVKMDNLTEALAKNMGQLHHLRTLCFGLDDQKWRNHASQMMNYESQDNPSRRTSLVQAFNAGYYLEKDRHMVCAEGVSLDVAALAENGRNIAAMLGDPYREN